MGVVLCDLSILYSQQYTLLYFFFFINHAQLQACDWSKFIKELDSDQTLADRRQGTRFALPDIIMLPSKLADASLCLA